MILGEYIKSQKQRTAKFLTLEPVLMAQTWSNIYDLWRFIQGQSYLGDI